MVAERAFADDFAGAADFDAFGGAFMRFEFGHKCSFRFRVGISFANFAKGAGGGTRCERGTVEVGNYFFRIPTERFRPLH